MYSPENVVTKFSDILSGNYNVKRDLDLNGQKIILYASLNLEIQHYALSKKIILDDFQTFDFLFCWIVQNDLTLSLFEKYRDWLINYAETDRMSKNKHMRSRFVGIIFIDNNFLDPEVSKKIKKFHKFYPIRFGFKGWDEIFFVAFLIKSPSWIIPRKGKDFEPLFEKLRLKLC